MRDNLIPPSEGWVWWPAERIEDAAGVMFLCPVCFAANGGPRGTHGVICWSPSVSQEHDPKPGRWAMEGTGLHDLSLGPKEPGGAFSVQLTTPMGCRAHFYVSSGRVAAC